MVKNGLLNRGPGTIEPTYFRYLNVQTGQYSVERYKESEDAYVDHIKVCGNETGGEPAARVDICLRINVRNFSILLSTLYPQQNIFFV